MSGAATTPRPAEGPTGRGDPGPSGPRAGAPRRSLSVSLTRFSGIYITALFILIFSLWVPDTFLTSATVKDILGSQAITAVVALGLLFSLAAGQYDLSTGSMVGASAMLTAWLTVEQGLSAAPAIAVALAFGFAIGAINALVVVGAGVHSFIATLGMSSVLLAIIQKVSDGQFLTGVPEGITSIAAHQPLGIPILAVYAVVVAIIAWYVLEHTPAGRRMHATGAGLEASRLAGVATNRIVFWSLVASSTVAALAGVLLTAKVGSASPDQSSAYLLPAFAAALLGTTQVLPGRVNVAGTMVAIVLLAVGIKGLQLAGAENWVTNLFNGLALIIAVSAANLGRVAQARRLRRRHTASPGRDPAQEGPGRDPAPEG